MRVPDPLDALEYRMADVKGKPIFYATSAEKDSAEKGSVKKGPAEDASADLPVILIHGVGLSHRYLLPVARLLAEDYAVYVPDLPGFGDSFKPRRTLTLDELASWVAAWMKTLRLGQTALLGNSIGCQVITSLAVNYPERVRCAILQGLTVDPEARTYVQQFVRWRRNQKVETGKKEGMGAYRDYWKCGIRRIIRTYGSAIEDNAEEKLPLIGCPTLVIRGTQDPIVSQEWSEEAARLLPNGRLFMIPGEGHTINYANPPALARAARTFLEGC